VHDCPEISNKSRTVHEKLERHRWVFTIILLNKVPRDKAHGANDERSEDVGGVPCILLAAPDKADDKGSEGVSVQDQDRVGEQTDVIEGIKTKFPTLDESQMISE
jgi:hypothetical protein